MGARSVCNRDRWNTARSSHMKVQESASVSMHEALIVTVGEYPSSLERPVPGRLAAVCWLLVLGLAFVGCQQDVDRAPTYERSPGVSVVEHWRTLLQIEDSLERTAVMAQFVTTLDAGDAEAVGEILTTRFRRHRAIDDLILWNAWSRLDPTAAAARAAKVTSPLAESLRGDLALEWALNDPLTAVETVGVDEPAIRRAVVRGWYASGVPGLSEFVLSSGEGRVRQVLLSHYAAELASDKGAEAVAAWLDDLRGRPELNKMTITNAHRKGIMEMAMADIDAAIAYCELHCDGPFGDSMRSRLADRLGMMGEEERAMLWLEGAVDANQEERGRAARLAMRSWLLSDRDAALAWADGALEKYKGEPWFLPPARIVLTVYTHRDPPTALDWVDIYEDPQDREDSLVRLARRWLELDAGAAEAWLATSPLDEEARAKARTPQKLKRAPRRKAN